MSKILDIVDKGAASFQGTKIELELTVTKFEKPPKSRASMSVKA
jgi:hypothetical protein